MGYQAQQSGDREGDADGHDDDRLRAGNRRTPSDRGGNGHDGTEQSEDTWEGTRVDARAPSTSVRRHEKPIAALSRKKITEMIYALFRGRRLRHFGLSYRNFYTGWFTECSGKRDPCTHHWL